MNRRPSVFCRTLLAGISIISLPASFPSSCAAQCSDTFPHDRPIISYSFEPRLEGAAIALHVKLKISGYAPGQFELAIPRPGKLSKRDPVVGLEALSDNLHLSNGENAYRKVVTFRTGEPLELAYDVIKDWDGPLVNHRQFEPVIFSEYFEFTGANALVHPELRADSPVSVSFDWTALPSTWAIASSFGTSTDNTKRCQSFTGLWGKVDNAVFAGGDFRIHHFLVDHRDTAIAIRGEWTFSDDDAEEQVRKALRIVRQFWQDDHFPYFLVTLAPFAEDGSTDGTAFTNAFWFFMGPHGRLSEPQIRIDLVHEAFHAWNSKRMGLLVGNQAQTDWFHEGFTDYYAALLSLRAGLIQADDYADRVNKALRDYPYSSSPYVRGTTIAIWLDSTIRNSTNQSHSLNDVMFQMVQSADKPFEESRILGIIDQYLRPEAQRALRQAIDNGVLPSFANVTVAPCLQVVMEQVPRFDFGLDYASTKASGLITGVEKDGPAYKAGLRDGERVLKKDLHNGHTDIAQTFVVEDGAKQQVIRYLAVGPTMLLPQLHVTREPCGLN